MEILTYAALGLSFLFLVLLIILFVQLQGLKKKYGRFMKGLGEGDVEQLMHQYAEELLTLRTHIENHTEPRIALIESKLPSTLRNVGLVSYNAFENMGNQMSFSVAALDDGKNGFVLTGIYGRDSSYVYAKELTAGVPSKELSSEEKEAYRKALENGRS